MKRPKIQVVISLIMMMGYCFRAYAVESEVLNAEKNETNVERVECSVPGLTVGKMFGIDKSLVEEIVRRNKINGRIEGNMLLDAKFGIFDDVTFMFGSGERFYNRFQRQTKQSETKNATNKIEYLQFVFRKQLANSSYEEFQRTFASVIRFVANELGCELQCPVISDPLSFSKFSNIVNVDKNPYYYRDYMELRCTVFLAKNLRVIVSGVEPTFLMRGAKTFHYKPGVIKLSFLYDYYSDNSEKIMTLDSKDMVEKEAVSINLGCDMSKSFESYVLGQISWNGGYKGRRVIRSKFEK